MAQLKAKLRPGLWPREWWWLEVYHPDGSTRSKSVRVLTEEVCRAPATILMRNKDLAALVYMDWGLELDPVPDRMSWNEWLNEGMPERWPL